MIRSFTQRLGQRNPNCVFEQLDPRCKLLIVLIVTIAIVFSNSLMSSGLFIAVGIVALFSRLTKALLFTSSFWVLLWCIFMLLFHIVMRQAISAPRAMFTAMVFKGTALIMTGLWFAVTTKLRDFTSALEAWRIPKIIILPLTIAVRFIPTLFHESLVIRDSMKLRRIAHRKRDLLKQPHLIGHSYLALITIRSLKMADELAAVAETRGLARPGKSKIFKPAQFKRNDYLSLSMLLVLIIVLIIASYFV